IVAFHRLLRLPIIRIRCSQTIQKSDIIRRELQSCFKIEDSLIILFERAMSNASMQIASCVANLLRFEGDGAIEIDDSLIILLQRHKDDGPPGQRLNAVRFEREQ